MYQALIIVHVLIAVGIIALVLLQHGRGADAGAAFGSGASGTVFGAQGSASFLTRATAVLATLFFTTSLGLAVVGDTRPSHEGFMEDGGSVPTDLPPTQPDLNSGPVSDMPSLPSPDEGSAETAAAVDGSQSPAAEVKGGEVPEMDGDAGSNTNEGAQPVPEEPETP
ncbi:MAG: preprotein translocase subunit SecG [Gammaproteobacteria bacterium]